MDTQTAAKQSEVVPSVVRIPTRRDQLLAFEIRKSVTAKDFREIAGILSSAYEAHGHVDLLVRIVGGIGFRFELMREHLFDVKRAALKHVDHYAVVGGPGWLETVIELLNPLFRMEVRHFDADDEDDAWEWLQDVQERS